MKRLQNLKGDGGGDGTNVFTCRAKMHVQLKQSQQATPSGEQRTSSQREDPTKLWTRALQCHGTL
jgi:hypothetical protein